jgi:hypothetical protein
MATEVYYSFGHTTFQNFVWLQGGALFENPRSLDVEMTNAGAYKVELWSAAGDLRGTGQTDNPIGGWHSFDFFQGQGGFTPPIPDGMFKVRFVNASAGTRDCHGGTLTMVRKKVWETLLQGILSRIRGVVFGR